MDIACLCPPNQWSRGCPEHGDPAGLEYRAEITRRVDRIYDNERFWAAGTEPDRHHDGERG